MRLRPVFRPGPRRESSQRSLRPLAGFRGALRGGKGKGGKEKGGDGKGRENRGRDRGGKGEVGTGSKIGPWP